MEKQRAVVVLSGGQDSTTCLYWALQLGYEVIAVTFNYGQRHKREIECAKRIAMDAGVLHEVIDIGPQILKGSSPLVSDNRLEEYSGFDALPGGLEKTFVPMRNQLFLTIAANRAYVHKAQFLVTGVCEEDYGGYPDCRQSFISKLQDACNLGTFTGEDGALPGLRIRTPLMRLTKAQSVELALNLPGCYAALAQSHTSYAGEYPPSSNDHASLLRAKGFFEADVPDPLVLRAYYEGVIGALPSSANYAPEKVAYYTELLKKQSA